MSNYTTSAELNTYFRDLYRFAGNIALCSDIEVSKMKGPLDLTFDGYTIDTIMDDQEILFDLEWDLTGDVITTTSLEVLLDKSFIKYASQTPIIDTFRHALLYEFNKPEPDYHRIELLIKIVFHDGYSAFSSNMDEFLDNDKIDNCLLDTSITFNEKSIFGYGILLNAMRNGTIVDSNKYLEMADNWTAPGVLMNGDRHILGKSISENIFDKFGRLPVPLLGKLLSSNKNEEFVATLLKANSPTAILAAISLPGVNSIKTINTMMLIEYATTNKLTELHDVVVDKCSDLSIRAYLVGDTSYCYSSKEIRLPDRYDFINRWVVEINLARMINNTKHGSYSSYINWVTSFGLNYFGKIDDETFYHILTKNKYLPKVFKPLFNTDTPSGFFMCGLAQLSEASPFIEKSTTSILKDNVVLNNIRKRIKLLVKEEPIPLIKSLSTGLIREISDGSDFEMWIELMNTPGITDIERDMIRPVIAEQF